MSRTSPARPQILSGAAANIADHPRITSSSEFKAFVQQQKTEAERRRADLLTEVDRLEAEINSRYMDIGHEDEIIARADAALTIDIPVTRQSPQLAVHTEVVDAINQTSGENAAKGEQ